MDISEVKDRMEAYLLVALGNPQPNQELMLSCDRSIANLERRIQVCEDELLKARALREQIQQLQQSMPNAQAVSPLAPQVSQETQ